jgi:hypothetical protein
MARQISITSELFQSLVEIDVNGFCIDLHNDYDCTSFTYGGATTTFCLHFRSITKNPQYPLVTLQFEQVSFYKINAGLETTPKSNTIDNIYRGKFKVNGNLYEFTEEGKSFYCLEFLEAYSFQFFAGRLLLVI